MKSILRIFAVFVISTATLHAGAAQVNSGKPPKQAPDDLDQAVRSKRFAVGTGTPDYILTLHMVQNAVATRFIGINDRGDIVGDAREAFQPQRGFLLSNGTVTIIDPPGATASQARNINNAGQIVGFYFDQNDIQHGYLYSNGKFTDIDFPEALDTIVTGINNKGDLVGGYDTLDGQTHGFLLRNGSFTSVDCRPGIATVVTDITDNGDLTGNCAYPTPDDDVAFVQDKQGNITFPSIPGALFSNATGENSRGTVVGVASDEDANRAFVLLKNGDLKIFGCNGSFNTQARSVNASGTIVGVCGQHGVPYGLIATPVNPQK